MLAPGITGTATMVGAITDTAGTGDTEVIITAQDMAMAGLDMDIAAIGLDTGTVGLPPEEP